MSDFKFSDLENLVNALYDQYYLPSNEKIKLAELLEDTLELKGKKSLEEAIATLKDKIRNELKNEMSSEMKQKINELERLETENKNLQTGKDKAERLNRALENVKNTAQNKNSEERVTRIATASTSLAVGLAIYITLEHTTRLDMWLMISIAVIPALITGIALKPSTPLNGAQELQEIANER